MFDSADKALYSMYDDKPDRAFMQADSLREKLWKVICTGR